MLRFLTAGESHGPSLSVIVEGLPSGLSIREDELADELARRRLGYGRGPRMRFERDELRLIGGDATRPHAGFAGGGRDHELRVAQVGRGDVRGARNAEQEINRASARATPTSPECRSTPSMTLATC